MYCYGRYKGLRDAAWRVFLDYGICALPVKVIALAKLAGIRVVENGSVHELSDREIGLSILDGEQWHIIFDETMIETRIRFTIAHELGHIFLGHDLKAGYHARKFERLGKEEEREADMFAIRLLAPACVLWGLDLHTEKEIAAVCNISASAARQRAARMEELLRRGKFLTSPIERKVYEQFHPFIEENK